MGNPLSTRTAAAAYRCSFYGNPLRHDAFNYAASGFDDSIKIMLRDHIIKRSMNLRAPCATSRQCLVKVGLKIKVDGDRDRDLFCLRKAVADRARCVMSHNLFAMFVFPEI